LANDHHYLVILSATRCNLKDESEEKSKIHWHKFI